MSALPPVPPIADANRKVSYAPNAPATVFNVPWPVFGDGSDLQVFYNGAPVPGIGTGFWQFTSPSGSLTLLAQPITDGQVVFAAPYSTGLIEIAGSWHVRQGNLPTSPSINRREFQQVVGQIVASLRELYSVVGYVLAMASSFRANKYAFFDSSGNLTAVSPAIAPINVGVRPFRTVVTATDSATIFDGVISWDFPFAVAKAQTIPSAAAVPAGSVLTIKDKSGGAAHVPIVIAPLLGASTIDLLASYPLIGAKASVDLISDGVSNWEII